MIDHGTVAAICMRAKQLAEEAPPLTVDQAYLLVSLFSRYPGGTTRKPLHGYPAQDHLPPARPASHGDSHLMSLAEPL